MSVRRRWSDEEPPPHIDVEVEEYGEGAPVVFLHGLLGLNQHWRPAVELISARSRCLLFQVPLLELRGPMCSVAGATALVTQKLVEALGDEPAVLVGNSLGGHIALRITIDRPELVRGIVLAGSSGLFERTFEKDVQHRPSREWIHRKIAELFHDPSRMPVEAVDRAYEELSQRRAARALVRLSRSAKADHMGSRMSAVSSPVMLLWGKQDIVTPPRVAEEFHSLLPDARLRWIDRCGHAPMIERPEEFAEGVTTFLGELTAMEEARPRQEVA